jgi:hypothetical protein
MINLSKIHQRLMSIIILLTLVSLHTNSQNNSNRNVNNNVVDLGKKIITSCSFLNDSILVISDIDGYLYNYNIKNNNLTLKDSLFLNIIDNYAIKDFSIILSDNSVNIFNKEGNPCFNFYDKNCKFSKVCINENNNDLAIATNNGFILLNLINKSSRKIEIKKEIWSLCYSNDNKDLILGCSDGKIILFDILTNKIVKTIVAHKEVVTSIFSANNFYISSDSRTISVWDSKFNLVNNRNINAIAPIENLFDNKFFWFDDSLKAVNILDVSKDTLSILNTNIPPNHKADEEINDTTNINIKGSLNVFSLKDKKEKSITIDKSLLTLAVSNDEKIMITGDDKAYFTIYNYPELRIINNHYLEFLEKNIVLTIRPDNKAFFVGTNNGNNCETDIETGKSLSGTWGGFYSVNSANYAPDNSFIQYTYSTNKGSVAVINNTSNYNPKKKEYSAMRSKRYPKIDDIYKGLRFFNDSLSMNASIITPDGKYIIVAISNKLCFWDAEENKDFKQIPMNSIISAMCFNPQKGMLILGDTLGKIKVLSTINNYEVVSEFVAHDKDIISIKVSITGDTLFTCTNKEIRAWALTDFTKPLFEIKEKNYINSIVYSKTTNSLIYITGKDTFLKQYNWKDEKVDKNYQNFLKGQDKDKISEGDFFTHFISNGKGNIFAGITMKGKLVVLK